MITDKLLNSRFKFETIGLNAKLNIVLNMPPMWLSDAIKICFSNSKYSY